MQIAIPELKISNVQINSHRNLIFRVTVKPEDYDGIVDLLYQTQEQGTPLSGVFVGFQERIVDNKPEKRQKLGALMSMYAEKVNMREEDLLGKMYAKYNVKSRTELTEEQLDAEIDSYSFGIQHD